MSLIKFSKWHRLFSLSILMILVALSASGCTIGTLISVHEYIQGNLTEVWRIAMMFAYPVFAFCSFYGLCLLAKKARHILKSDKTEVINSKVKN